MAGVWTGAKQPQAGSKFLGVGSHRQSGLRRGLKQQLPVALIAVFAGLVAVSCSPEPNATSDESDVARFGEAVDAYISAINGDFETDYEEAVAACMRERGFEYIPLRPEEPALLDPASARDGLSRLEDARENGFGISTFYEATTQPPTDPRAFSRASAARKNSDVLAELREKGELVEMEWHFAHDGLTRHDGSRMIGCTVLARDQTGIPPAVVDQFGAALEDHGERVRSSPNWAAAVESYERCFAQTGFGFADVEQARSDISRDYDQLVASAVAELGKREVTNDGPDGEPITMLINPELSGDFGRRLSALQEAEREVAVAHISCQDAGSPSVNEISEVHEAQFVEGNKALVDAVTAS